MFDATYVFPSTAFAKGMCYEPFVKYGNFSGSDSTYSVGAVVEFSCDPGYTLEQGSVVIECVDAQNPQWNETEPACRGESTEYTHLGNCETLETYSKKKILHDLILKNTPMFSYCPVLQCCIPLLSETLSFSSCSFKAHLSERPVCSDWSAHTCLSQYH